MVRGLYTSAISMAKIQKKMDVTSNNLANISTTAYKKDTTISQSFPEVLTRRINDITTESPTNTNIGNMSLGSDIAEIYTQYTLGTLVETGRQTDVALNDDGTGFFVASVNNGEMYTRNGSWTINAAGYLVTEEGYPILGQNGQLQVDNDNFTIQNDGRIYSGNRYIDTLRVVSFEDTSQLQKYGNNLVQVQGNAQVVPFNGQIKQGFIENSNVNPIQEMVEIINVMRSYEANQKVIKAYDDTLDKAINEVGRV